MSSRKRLTLAQGGVANTSKVDKKFHYVDNEQFYQDIKEYLIKRKADVEAGKPIPAIPNSIGIWFERITEFESRKHNFVGYSFKDEMKSDAILNMCHYIDKFNWENNNNPFGYFKQCCYFSFILTIKKEKKESLAKAAIVNSLGTLIDDLVTELQDEDSHFKNAAVELLQLRSSDIIKTHEDSQKAKKLKKSKQVSGSELVVVEELSDEDELTEDQYSFTEIGTENDSDYE